MIAVDSHSILFIWLGNPGASYRKTRHNMGFMVIESFANRMGWSLREDLRFKGKIGKGVDGDVKVHLFLPLTYMNLSGEAVRCYMDYFALGVDQIIVVSDDAALSFGTIPRRFSTASPCGSMKAKPLPSSMSCNAKFSSSTDLPVPVWPII